MKPCHFAVYSKMFENNSVMIEKLKKELGQNGFVYDENKPSLIIVLGGDGSFMRAIHDPKLPRGKEISYLLFNTGHLGFYSDYAKGEEDAFIHALINQEPVVEYLPFFRFVIDKKKEHHFINDIAIQTGETVFMDVYVNNEMLTESRCNGIVIGTPTGSSGYLLSLNSPVVINAPDLYQFSLISPCHNRLFPNTITKAIIGGDQELKVIIHEGNFDIYVDGGHKTKLKGHEFTFSHKKDELVSLLHLKSITVVSRIRKNISGKED